MKCPKITVVKDGWYLVKFDNEPGWLVQFTPFFKRRVAECESVEQAETIAVD